MTLRTDRSIWKYIGFSILTCGIYSYWFIYQMALDSNSICEGDGEETMGLAAFILLSIVTCGFYSWYWEYKLGNRLAKNAPRYGLQFQEDGSSVLTWLIFGSLLCGVGAFIAMNILIKNLNALSVAYNQLNGAGGYQQANGVGGYQQANGAGGYQQANGAGGYRQANGAGGYQQANGAGGYQQANGAGGYQQANGAGGYQQANGAGGYQQANGAGGYQQANGAGGYQQANGAGGYQQANGAGGYQQANGVGGYQQANGAGGYQQAIGNQAGYANGAQQFTGRITGVTGQYTGSSINLMSGMELVIGTDPSVSQLIIAAANKNISRKHCSIRYNQMDGYYYVVDYSTNGTYYANGTRMQQGMAQKVRPGESIYLSNQNLMFKLEEY